MATVKTAKSQRRNTEKIFNNKTARLAELLESQDRSPEDVRERLVSVRDTWNDLNERQVAVLSLLDDDDESQDDVLTDAMNKFEDIVEKTNKYLKGAEVPDDVETAAVLQDLVDRQESRYTLADADLKDVEDKVQDWKAEGQASKEGVGVLRELLVSVEAQLAIIEEKHIAIMSTEKNNEKKKEIDKNRVSFVSRSKGRVTAARVDLALVESTLVSASEQLSRTNSVSEVTPDRTTDYSQQKYLQNYFARRSVPVFSGKARDYPGFRKEWKETVARVFPDDALQLREFMKSVPKVIQPEIKYAKKMSEAWAAMDAEYGRVTETVTDLVNGLVQFQSSSSAKNDQEKFAEVYAKWREVNVDLAELEQIQALDHAPTLMSVVNKLPGTAPKERYIDIRLKGQVEKKSELKILAEFMELERDRQRQLARVQAVGGGGAGNKVVAAAAKSSSGDKTAAKKTGNCNNCGESGHWWKNCPQPKKPRDRASAHANLKEPPEKPCPVCGSQHTVDYHGTTLFKTRLSSCEAFRSMDVAARAGVVQTARGCALCLDWTGKHQRNNCDAKIKMNPFPKCEVQENGSKCGANHHKLLHGANTAYTNFVSMQARVCSTQGPSRQDLERDREDDRAFMQLQRIQFVGNDNPGLVFFDSGSDINLVRKSYASELGLEGRAVQQRIQTTGGKSDVWNTVAYFVLLVDNEGNQHRVLAYEMEVITAPHYFQNIEKVKEIFPGVVLEDVARPVGEVDLLLGVRHANLHPVPVRWNGELRLLRSKFGTGFLLDGYHPLLHSATRMYLSREANALRCGVLGAPVFTDSPSAHFTMKTPRRGVSAKPFTFPECEEMGTGQPRRCNRCRNCAKCSESGQQMSRREAEELALIEDSVVVLPEEKKTIMKYPLIGDPGQLGDNFLQAVGFAKGLENNLIKYKQLDEYNEQFKEFLDRGVIRQITSEEVQKWQKPFNYISHHGVVKMSSTTTRLRIVSNSSLNNCNQGLSLNDLLPKGPNSITPLFRAMMRWRSYSQVVTWDLAKAYNTVVTTEEDMHLRRLVWRFGNKEEDFKVFGFLVMTFGDRVAGCALEVAKRKAAELADTVLEDAGSSASGPSGGKLLLHHNTVEEVKSMIRDGYVDDGSGGGTREAVEELMGEVKHEDESVSYEGAIPRVMAVAGFKVKVMVRSGETRQDIITKLGDGVLGLPWDPTTDKISMNMKVNVTPKSRGVRKGPDVSESSLGDIDKARITRRLVVSQVYSVYDPAGFLSPITIKLKLLLQRLSVVNGKDNSAESWDRELDEELAEEARDALKEMVSMKEVVCPRSWWPEGVKPEFDFAVWFDGGKPAFCATIYAVFELMEEASNGDTSTANLVAAKARVKPSTEVESIPRTEMSGALMAHRLVSEVLQGVKQLPHHIHIFGDSECTIHSINNKEIRLAPWFGNRVAEIKDHQHAWKKMGINVPEVKHWPGTDNPADLGTKGKAEWRDLSPDGMWLCGPRAMRTWELGGPESTGGLGTRRTNSHLGEQAMASHQGRRGLVSPPGEEDGEISGPCGPGTTENSSGFCDPYAMGPRVPLCGVNAKKIIQYREPKLFSLVKEVSQRRETLHEVLGVLARYIQASVEGREDIRRAPSAEGLLQARKLLHLVVAEDVGNMVINGKLTGLCPFWKDGAWVTRGRLGKEMKRLFGVEELVILPEVSRVAALYMWEAHLEDHSGPKITLWRSRSKVWILGASSLARRLERSCLVCRRRKACVQRQRMGDIDSVRLQVGSKPFMHIALDLMGPITVKAMCNARARMKVWPILFVCQSTGALHIAAMHDQGTEAFLIQWDHFTALRGSPSTVTSDKGSQLTAKTNVVTWNQKEDPTNWEWEEIEEKTARMGVKWRFVPMGCQWRNGLAESRVGATKRTLDHVLRSTLIGEKPTMNYAELCSVLSRVASIVNDRPVGVRAITEEDIQPLTINQLLLGRTGAATSSVASPAVIEDFGASRRYHEEILNVWWAMWKKQVLPSLLPYARYKDAGRHKNLRAGDVCLLFRDSKIRGSYQLCKVEGVEKDESGLVRTVIIASIKRGVVVEERMAVQRLVLIVAKEDEDEENEEPAD